MPSWLRALLTLVLAVSMVVGCTSRPILYSEDMSEAVDKPSVAAAAVHALQARGYIIVLINEATGTVTTDWADVTGMAGYLLGTMTRKRVMVSVAPDGSSVNVQVTKQQRTQDAGWQNAQISGGDREDAQGILQAILRSL
jgi:hypothetical protein